MDTVLIAKDTGLGVHEVISAFQSSGMPLSRKLTEMLNEHFSHQSERRGCGYTQSTRELADFISQPRSLTEYEDLRLFDDSVMKPLRDVMIQAKSHGLTLSSWRNLDINLAVQDYLQAHDPAKDAFTQALKDQVEWQQRLRQIHTLVTREESLLVVAMIQDLILPTLDPVPGLVTLPVLGEKPKVGSCPMAEKFFFEVAYRRIPRRGLVNVFVDSNNRPLIIEKINMGDDHSCISLGAVVLNGVRLPAGSSFSVAYDPEKVRKEKAKGLAGDIIPLADVDGFWFLRLTTLAVSPQNRERAFSTHFHQQIENNLFSPDIVTLAQLREVAEQQVTGVSPTVEQTKG